MKRIWIVVLLIAGSLEVSAQVWSGSTTNDLTQHDGGVGIGVAALSTVKLNIQGTGYWHFKLRDTNTGNDWFVGSSGDDWASGPGKLVFSPTAASNQSVLTLTPTGRVGIGSGNTGPRAMLDVGYIASGNVASTFARISEGDANGAGTFLGVRTFDVQPVNVKSFALEHSFYGNVNSAINFHRGGGTTGGFMVFTTNNNNERMRILTNGNICIGTTVSNGYKLAVEGTIGAREINVNASTWSDYVFDADYKLLPLTEVEKYIAAHHHLPEVPSAADVEEKGIDLGEMNALLLKKIEELTLHMIDQEKRIKELEAKR